MELLLSESLLTVCQIPDYSSCKILLTVLHQQNGCLNWYFFIYQLGRTIDIFIVSCCYSDEITQGAVI